MFKSNCMTTLLCVCALGLAAPACAQQAAPVASPAVVPAPANGTTKVDPNAKECRYEEVMGSRFKKRTCRTHEQWQQAQADAQRYVSEKDRKSVPTSGQ